MRIITFLCFIICLASCYRKAPLKTGLEGSPLPAFNFLLMDSSTKYSTAKIQSGRPVMLFYFSPRCPYCKAELNMLLGDIEKFKGTQICLVTNNFPFGEVKRFCDEFKLDQYTNITVGYDSMYAVAKYFKVSGVPFISIYGKDRMLKAAFAGMVKPGDMFHTYN